jgi:hypothetical protein
MTDTASSPDPVADGSSGRSYPGRLPVQGEPWLSDEDVLALLDGLGVAGTHDREEDQEAIAAAQWEALQACGEAGADSEPTAVSPVLVAEHLPAGPGLAAVLALDPAAQASDWDLPGLAAEYRRLAAWAQAQELAACAEIAARRAAANPKIGADDDGRPASLPPGAAAEVALELAMTQPGASAWTALGCQLRWDLRATGAALATGRIDLGRARIIAEATVLLTSEHAAAVEARVLPHAAGQTTGQLRAAIRRAVLAIDPDGADQRRRDTERSAKVGLYPGEEGTATLTGSSLPGIEAAAAMARITALARALKSAGANGGIDILRANVFLGLLLGTLPLIPPPADGPPDNPPPDGDPDGGPDHDGETGPLDQNDTSSGTPADDSRPAPGSGTSADGGSPTPDSTDSNSPAPDGSSVAPNDADQGDRGPSSPAPAGNSPAPDDGSRAPGSNSLTPDSSPVAGEAGPAGHGPPGCGPPGCGHHARGERNADHAENTGHAENLPGWWPDIPPPDDPGAPPDACDPPDTGDPPDPPWARAGESFDTGDDEWPQLPPPDWPPLPAQLPAPCTSTPGPTARPPLGLLDILIGWSTLTGHTAEPAVLGRIGPVGARQARHLVTLAGLSPQTEWRVVVTDDDGRAVAVERARPGGRPRASGCRPRPADNADVTGVVGRVTISIRERWLGTARATAPGGPSPVAGIAAAVLRAADRAAARARAERAANAQAGACTHTRAADTYRPPARLRNLVAARDITCRFTTCGQPAWRADLDHTIPWHKGGLTCICNLGGFCRTHHNVKQLPGWHVEQPQPGTFRWTTPAGRCYQTQPDPYPV